MDGPPRPKTREVSPIYGLPQIIAMNKSTTHPKIKTGRIVLTRRKPKKSKKK